MEKVTVVIPNFDGMKFLQDCLQSLMEQEPGTPDFRVLVVDNGSQDGSPELVREKFPQVDLEALSENTGFCHAVNVGIKKARSPYVILLNNDTKVMPGFVAALYRAIEKRPEAFAVSAKMLMWDRPELVDDAGDRYCALGWAYARGKGKPASEYGKAAQVFSACGGAAIYRMRIFDRVGLFDEAHFAYLEDLDIGWRARIYGYRSFYEPLAEVIHYGSASTGSRYNERKTYLASANSVYVIGKNMPLFQKILNMPFFVIGFFVKFLFFCKKGMGGLYLQGILQGLKKIYSHSGREKKVEFCANRLPAYFAIQGQLYLNLVRFLKKN